MSRNFVQRLIHDEGGQDLLEYTLIIALIAVIVVGAIAVAQQRDIREVVASVVNIIKTPKVTAWGLALIGLMASVLLFRRAVKRRRQ